MRSPISRAALVATAAAGLLSASPAVAATGSAVVYVNGDGNIWQVQPDGTGGHAVSADGTKAKPYARPRLAPDGTIWALRGFAVVHLAADGQTLSSFTPTPPKDSDGVPTIDEPEFFDVSPDGTKLAYGVDNIRCEDDGSCNTDGVVASSTRRAGRSRRTRASATPRSSRTPGSSARTGSPRARSGCSASPARRASGTSTARTSIPRTTGGRASRRCRPTARSWPRSAP